MKAYTVEEAANEIAQSAMREGLRDYWHRTGETWADYRITREDELFAACFCDPHGPSIPPQTLQGAVREQLRRLADVPPIQLTPEAIAVTTAWDLSDQGMIMDVDDLRLGVATPEEILTAYTHHAQKGSIPGWKDYVTAIATAAGVEFQEKE